MRQTSVYTQEQL